MEDFMDLYDVKQFLMWCAMLNGVTDLFLPVLCRSSDLIYKLHSRWFPISRNHSMERSTR
jgi:hypothetical protein